MKRTQSAPTRNALDLAVSGGRSSLLMILIFTAVNLLFIVLDVDRYFLFSASVPYYLTMIGKGIDNGFVDGAWEINGTYAITGLVISAVILAIYLLCWLLSKKKTGWLTAALVLFLLDTLALVVFTFALYDDPMINLMDFLLHGWVIWELFRAVRSAAKRKKLPVENVHDFSDGIPTLDTETEDYL